MKKFYLFIAMMLFVAPWLKAQSAADLQFVYLDDNGQEIGTVADNAIVNVSKVVEPVYDFDDPYISSGLAVKNVAANGRRVQLAYDITALPNGRHDICFFGACMSDNTTGSFTYPRLSNKGNIVGLNALKAGSVTSLKAEWYCTAAGTATVVYKANICTGTGEAEDGVNAIYAVSAEGPTVTVNYIYDPSGVDEVTIDNPVKTLYYNMAGCLVEKPESGLFIMHNTYANGKVVVKKVMF